MSDGGPPTFAWDWLARQRLPWQEVRRRLVERGGTERAARYGAGDARHDVMALLRVDYPVDPVVRTTVDAVLVELVLLGRVDVPLAERGVVAPPRGLRWWVEHLAADAGVRAPIAAVPPPGRPTQLALALDDVLDDVLAGYGDGAAPATAPRARGEEAVA